MSWQALVSSISTWKPELVIIFACIPPNLRSEVVTEILCSIKTCLDIVLYLSSLISQSQSENGLSLQKQHPVCGFLSNYDYSRPGLREGIIERAELRHRPQALPVPLLSCVARSIKISTWVSVGAGLSLHRHQANFSRVFDIYFARYYWNIFTLFPQIFSFL